MLRFCVWLAYVLLGPVVGLARRKAVVQVKRTVDSQKSNNTVDHKNSLKVLIDDVDCRIEQADGDKAQQNRLLDQRIEYMKELDAAV